MWWTRLKFNRWGDTLSLFNSLTTVGLLPEGYRLPVSAETSIFRKAILSNDSKLSNRIFPYVKPDGIILY